MKKWYSVALFNLFVLAFLGLILRFKINFSLPSLDYTNLLHAHSHFAFSGWISFLLQLLILDEFTNNYKKSKRFWDGFFIASTITNYAMIISFALVGYAGISIILSTIGLWLSYIFAYKIYKTLTDKESTKVSTGFVKASLFFLLLSSIGPYALAAVTANHSTNYNLYHNALYFFLHFQYNGWFTLGVLALMLKKLEALPPYNHASGKTFYMLTTAACIPSYLFITQWNNRPLLITIIMIITAVIQTASLYFLWKVLRDSMYHLSSKLSNICKWLYSFAIIAFVLKILLQFFSIHPTIASLAFGFRPIIIGYLHLIFLAFVSMYLIAVLADKKIVNIKHRISSAGLITFAAGIVINEVLLAIQGVCNLYSFYVPKVDLLLFVNTIILVAGAILLFIASRKPHVNSYINYKPLNHHHANFRNIRCETYN